MPKPVYKKFIKVGGHDLWCLKWAKNGEPVVLLHGGLSHTAKWEKYILPAVSKTHEPFAYDRTAHGYTKVRKGYMHFDFQVEELVKYLKTIVKKPAQNSPYKRIDAVMPNEPFVPKGAVGELRVS